MIRFLTTLLAVCAVAGPARAQLTLVDEGQARAVIVVPNEQHGATRLPAARLTGEGVTVALAAVELADYLERVTGARLSIASDLAPPPADRARIFVGPCRGAPLPEGPESLRPEEILLRVEGSSLVIAGGDRTPEGLRTRGTLFAVYAFLEDIVGVRWLHPGPVGEVVPRRATLAVGPLDRREQPRVEKRKVRNVALSREETYAPRLAAWQVPIEAWRAAHGPDATGPWFRRQRLGARIEVEGGHAYAGYWERLGQSHPEFFALQPDGTRTQRPPRERLCKSNPALWDYIAAERIAEFRAHPERLTASISPNDGGQNVFCMCDACRALDPPEAPKLLADRSLIDPATRQPFPEYPSLSDRVFTFYNEIARRVRAELPERRLVCYAYSVYRTPPVRIEALEPNLIVGYVGLDPQAIEAWARIAPALYVRPNDLGPAVDLGLPRNHAAHLARMVRFAVERRAIGFDFDNCHGNWAGHGLDYYVLVRALWNPDLDPHAVIDDYCRAAYGPAAPAMRRYHDRLERISDAVRADEQLGPRSPAARRLLRHYTPAELDALETDLAQARAALGPADADCRPRIEMAAVSMRYARAVTKLLEVAGQRESPQHAERLRAVETLLREQVLTLNLASLHSERYLRMALAYADREVE